jgi:hypothetical protein
MRRSAENDLYIVYIFFKRRPQLCKFEFALTSTCLGVSFGPFGVSDRHRKNRIGQAWR